MCVCVHARVCARAHLCVCLWLWACFAPCCRHWRSCRSLGTHAYTHVCARVCTRVCLHTCPQTRTGTVAAGETGVLGVAIGETGAGGAAVNRHTYRHVHRHVRSMRIDMCKGAGIDRSRQRGCVQTCHERARGYVHRHVCGHVYRQELLGLISSRGGSAAEANCEENAQRSFTARARVSRLGT